MKKFVKRITTVIFAIILFPPGWVWAAGGGEVEQLVHVADTRNLSGIYLYFSNLYNENIFLFAIWTVGVITAMGAGLGLFMDFLLSKTGLDLTSRELHE